MIIRHIDYFVIFSLHFFIHFIITITDIYCHHFIAIIISLNIIFINIINRPPHNITMPTLLCIIIEYDFIADIIIDTSFAALHLLIIIIIHLLIVIICHWYHLPLLLSFHYLITFYFITLIIISFSYYQYWNSCHWYLLIMSFTNTNINISLLSIIYYH